MAGFGGGLLVKEQVADAGTHGSAPTKRLNVFGICP